MFYVEEEVKECEYIYRVKGEGSVERKLRDKWWESTKSEGGVWFDLVHVWKEW